MDKMMMVWVSQHRTPFMDWLLEIITWAGSLYLLLPVSLLLAVCLIAWGKKDAVWLLALGFGGALLFAYLLKLGIRRPRPDLFLAMIPVPADFSFPSAHTTQITAFCICLVIFMVRYGSIVL